MQGFWTEQRVGVLTEMHNAGHSTSAIGAAVGCTRNAVIGKLARMGMSRQQPRMQERVAKSVAKVASVEDRTLAQSLLELRYGQCRWPLQNDFCESDALLGSSYCAFHCRKAVQKIRGLRQPFLFSVHHRGSST